LFKEIDSYKVRSVTGQHSNNVNNSSMVREQNCRDLFSFSILRKTSFLPILISKLIHFKKSISFKKE